MQLELAHANHFQESAVPKGTRLAGWAALAQALSIKAPVRRPSCVSEKHIKGSQREEGTWQVFTSDTGPEIPLPIISHSLFGMKFSIF
jgi:hypothetical protein